MDDALGKALAAMIDAASQSEGCEFHVGVVGYFIDGIPYVADGLAVSRTQTANLIYTHDGFACDAAFPADLLERVPVTTERKVVQVRVEVKRRDIWLIAEFIA